MKRILFAVFVGLILTACGLVPVAKESLKEGEMLAVAIEGYSFYEKLVIKELGGGRASFSIDLSSPLRNDEISKGVLAALGEEFPVALRERGVAVADESPMKIYVNVAQGATSGMVYFVGAVVVKKDGVAVPSISALAGYADPFGSLFSPDSGRNVRIAKNMAGRLSNLLANTMINQYHGVIK